MQAFLVLLGEHLNTAVETSAHTMSLKCFRFILGKWVTVTGRDVF